MTKVKTHGLYPKNTIGSIMPNPATLDPNDFCTVPGVFGNDQGHDFDVSLAISITPSKLENLISTLISISNDNLTYNLGTFNCTDIAITLFENSTNTNLPSCESNVIIWDGQTPGTLGEVIRDLPLPTGAIKNTSGGTAPLNNSN